MAEIVYVLCAATCLMCAVALGRGYSLNRHRLLLWSALCFAGLFVNNLLTIIDLVVVPDIDLRPLRSGVALASLTVLALGLIREHP